jgi:Na+/H+ antiporter NhaA
LKTASVLHVNSQSLVLADYGVKTGYCQLYGASLLRFSVEMFPASLRSRQKTQVLQQNVKIYSLVFSILACAWEPIICRLSSNNRPITDYLKNGRLIGFTDY